MVWPVNKRWVPFFFFYKIVADDSELYWPNACWCHLLRWEIPERLIYLTEHAVCISHSFKLLLGLWNFFLNIRNSRQCKSSLTSGKTKELCSSTPVAGEGAHRLASACSSQELCLYIEWWKEAGIVWKSFLLGCLVLRGVSRTTVVPRTVPMLAVVAAMPWQTSSCIVILLLHIDLFPIF